MVSGAATTLIENAGNDAENVPSLTLITMFEYVPACEDVGAPDSVPLVVLKLAQAGGFCTLNVSLSPSGSDAVGVKVYSDPTLADVGGLPEIVGGEFALETVMENAASALDCVPSLTLITMLA
jgi:hypothetical protein